MPLTAALPNATVIDATQCSEQEWASVYRTALTAQLTCRGCGHRMIAKRSSTGLRFFAHRADRPEDCPSAGESVAHMELKRTLAEHIRAGGAQAVLEATPTATDIGGWRADVLCICPDGRRIAFEAQLAAMTVEEGQARTAKYQSDDIGVAWVTTKHAHWVSRIPSMRVVCDDTGAWATRGIGKRGGFWGWQQPEPVELGKVVRGLIAGSVEPTQVRSHDEEVGGKTHVIFDAVLLVPSVEVRALERAEAAAERERAREQAQHALHIQNILALQARQSHVLQAAVRDAIAAGIPAHQIWLGVPATWWNGGWPIPLQNAMGNPRTAMGLAIWVGPIHSDIRLWAIICPVAGRCTPGLGWSWHKRDVRVYAASNREATRLAESLGRPVAGVHIREAETAAPADTGADTALETDQVQP